MEKAKTPLSIPVSAIGYLAGAVPAKGILKALKQRPDLCNHVFQGFEVKQQSLALPLLRQRLARVITEDAELRETALTLWEEEGVEVCTEVRERSLKTLEAEIEGLAGKWGGPAIGLALAGDHRKSARDLLTRVAETLGKYPSPGVREQLSELPPSVVAVSREDLLQDITKLKQQLESLSRKFQEAKEGMHNSDTQARAALAQCERMGERAALAERKVASLEKAFERLRKALDRAERVRDRAVDECRALNREITRLRTQLVPAEAEPLPPAGRGAREGSAGKTAAKRSEGGVPPVPAEPDQRFQCQIDGMHYTLSLRQMLRAIQTNNEDEVKELSGLLAALRRTDRERHKAVLNALSKEGRYYARVLIERMTAAIVDGSNVAHCEKDEKGRAKLQTVLNVREELRFEGCFPIWIYVDASLPHQIDNPRGLEALIQSGEILRVPSGTSADEAITRHARDCGACVVTNDRRIADMVDPTLNLDTIGFVVFNADVALRP